jgi:hypothetical protein
MRARVRVWVTRQAPLQVAHKWPLPRHPKLFFVKVGDRLGSVGGGARGGLRCGTWYGLWFLWGATLPSPMAWLATVVAFALATPSSTP